MLDKAFVETLLCPENHARLRIASAAELARLNQAIAAGQIQDQRGRPARQPVQEGLVREDRGVVYPVMDGIPMLLVEEGLVVPDQILEA